MSEWTVKPNAYGGGYRVHDEDGKVVGSYSDSESAAIHHALSIRGRRSAEAILHNLLDLIDMALPIVSDPRLSPSLILDMRKAKEMIRDHFGFNGITKIDVNVEEPAVGTKSGPVTVDQCVTSLLLTEFENHESVERAVTDWTPEQRQVAFEWAAREHLHASDNDDVERISCPQHVNELRASERIAQRL